MSNGGGDEFAGSQRSAQRLEELEKIRSICGRVGVSSTRVVGVFLSERISFICIILYA